MSETHQIDQLFRDGLYSREITYDPQDWLNAKEVLDDHYRSRKYRRFFKYLLALLLVVSSSVFFNQNQSDFEDNSNVESKSGTVASNESKAHETGEDLFHSADDNILTNENNLILDDGIESEDNLSNESIDNSENNIAGTITENSSDTDVQAMEIKESESDNFEETLLSSEENTSQVNQNVVLEPVMNDNTESKVELNSITNAQSSPQLQKDDFSQSYGMPNESVASGELEKMTMLQLQHDFAEEMPLEEVEEMPGIGKDKTKEYKTTGLKLILGGGMTNHVNAETNENVTGYSMFLGIGYEKLVMQNVSLEARLIVSRRNAFDLLVQSEQTQYGLGYESDFSKTEFNYLDYLEMPLFVNYFIHPLHQIGAGLQINYAIAQVYDQANYSQNSFTPVDSVSGIPAVNMSNEKQYKATSVIKNFDLAFILYYHYSLNERMKIGAGLQLGMMDVVKSQYIIDRNYKNNQLRLNLTYRILN